jgi:hypothetical protein
MRTSKKVPAYCFQTTPRHRCGESCLPLRALCSHAGKPGGAKLGVGAKTAYGAPQFRVLHWVKAPRGSGTVWCDVADPLPGLPQPYSNALEKLFGVKPAVKPAAGMSQLLIICTNITTLQ